MCINLILLWSPSSKAKVNNGQFLELRMCVLDSLEGLVEFLHLGIKLNGISDD